LNIYAIYNRKHLYILWSWAASSTWLLHSCVLPKFSVASASQILTRSNLVAFVAYSDAWFFAWQVIHTFIDILVNHLWSLQKGLNCKDYKKWDWHTSSTLKAVLAEVSMNIRLLSRAKRSPSSVETCLLWSRSHLLPISMITISGFPFYLTSSSHLVKWLNVSRLFPSIIREN